MLLLAGFIFGGLPQPLAAQPVNLNDTFRQWGFSPEKSTVPGLVRWKNQWSRLEVEANKKYITLNGIRVWLNDPIAENRGTHFMQRADFNLTLLPIVAPQPQAAVPVVRRVLLDPGHGGKDPGMQNTRLGLNEKTFTLDVARRVKFILEQHGLQVALTRTTDTFVELDQRALLARKTSADLFVSIHFNSAGPSAGPSGIETFVLTPQGQHSTNDPGRAAKSAEINATEPGHRHNRWNTLLGYHLQTNLVTKLEAEDRGLRRARFTVLRGLSCPGALVECGFMSNPAEVALINKPAHREKVAQAIADGILNYQKIVRQLAEASRTR